MVSLCWRNFLRVASRREPPAPRELDRQERTGPTWPNQSRLGSRVHERTAPYRRCYQKHSQSNFSMTLPSVSNHHSCTGCSQASCPGRQGQAWPDRVLFGSVSLNCIHFARLRKSLLDFPSSAVDLQANEHAKKYHALAQVDRNASCKSPYIYTHIHTYIGKF